MSHYFGIVLVDPARSGDLLGAVGEMLQPFDEQYMTDDDETRAQWWDWWRVGGRWDGVILGKNRNYDCPLCFVDGKETGNHCHYTSEHEQLIHNSVPVMEMGECRPFTLVTPEGLFSHREHFRPAIEGEDRFGSDWPWVYEDNPEHDRFVGEQLLAHRDHVAVGFDYHS